MAILNDLLANLPEYPVPVRKIMIGVHWTMICSIYCGLGSTMVESGQHGQSPMRDVGNLHHKSAQDLAHLVLSDNLLEASVGLAAINSLVHIDESQAVQLNAADLIAKVSTGRNLAFVGHFPFIDRLRGLAKNCWVIEKRPTGDDLSEGAAAEYLPMADVVAITGTTLINHTLDELLSLCRRGAVVGILGPSTPLTSRLFDYGVSFVSGSKVIDEESVAVTIMQGAIFPQVKGVRLLTMTRGLSI